MAVAPQMRPPIRCCCLRRSGDPGAAGGLSTGFPANNPLRPSNATPTARAPGALAGGGAALRRCFFARRVGARRNSSRARRGSLHAPRSKPRPSARPFITPAMVTDVPHSTAPRRAGPRSCRRTRAGRARRRPADLGLFVRLPCRRVPRFTTPRKFGAHWRRPSIATSGAAARGVVWESRSTRLAMPRSRGLCRAMALAARRISAPAVSPSTGRVGGGVQPSRRLARLTPPPLDDYIHRCAAIAAAPTRSARLCGCGHRVRALAAGRLVCRRASAARPDDNLYVNDGHLWQPQRRRRFGFSLFPGPAIRLGKLGMHPRRRAEFALFGAGHLRQRDQG